MGCGVVCAAGRSLRAKGMLPCQDFRDPPAPTECRFNVLVSHAELIHPEFDGLDEIPLLRCGVSQHELDRVLLSGWCPYRERSGYLDEEGGHGDFDH